LIAKSEEGLVTLYYGLFSFLVGLWISFMEILTNGVKEVGMGMGMEWKGYLWLLYVFRILAFFILVRGLEVGIRE
jgi:hypothetical protein